MRTDIFPQPLLRLLGQVDHFLDVHDVVLNKVHHISAGFAVYIVIDRDHGVVLIPTPVFLPGKCVAEETAVRCGGKLCVQIAKIAVVPGYAPYIAWGCRLFRDLAILNGIGKLIRDDLPPHFSVERDGVRKEQSERLTAAAHMVETLVHQSFHNPMSGVFRIGTYTRYKSNGIYRSVHIHFQWIYGYL